MVVDRRKEVVVLGFETVLHRMYVLCSCTSIEELVSLCKDPLDRPVECI